MNRLIRFLWKLYYRLRGVPDEEQTITQIFNTWVQQRDEEKPRPIRLGFWSPPKSQTARTRIGFIVDPTQPAETADTADTLRDLEPCVSRLRLGK